MELQLPPFKTRNVLVDDMNVRDKQATAVVRVNETSWWGWRKRELKVVITCDHIKKPKWESMVVVDNGCISVPVRADSDVLRVANNTLADMRNMNLKRYDQLLAHRLSIHMRKHHGKAVDPYL